MKCIGVKTALCFGLMKNQLFDTFKCNLNAQKERKNKSSAVGIGYQHDGEYEIF